MLRRLCIAALACAALSAGAGAAQAYPQFQFSTGSARCNLCHYAPAGGGLINGWGRLEAADTISSMGGDGAFLYGAWELPDWLALGADLRGVTGVRDAGAVELDYLLFPMQADLYTRFELPADLTLAVTVGARGAARDRDSAPHTRVASREHYLMWQPKSTGPYVRAGRFYAPFGLRQVDHTMYVRRYLGYYAFEETYNVSGGVVQPGWEAHVTAFAPDPYLQAGEGPYGGAATYESRFAGDTAAWGTQARVELDDSSRRYIAGGLGKWYWEDANLLVLAELDVAAQTFDAEGADARMQWLGHLNTTYFLTQGWMLGAVLERYDEDVSLSGTQRDAASLLLQYFPLAHWEVMLMGRVERVGGGEQSRLGFLMLHYYL